MQKIKLLPALTLFSLLVWNPGWSQTHFSINSSTVALWTFNGHNSGTFTDAGSNGFNLSGASNFNLVASPYDSAAVFTGNLPEASSYLSHAYASALTIGATGQITYEARIYLTQYDPVNHGWVIGTYDGVQLDVSSTGQIVAGGQKVLNGTGYWIEEVSVAGAIPLNQWVDVAVAFDQTTGNAYGYINGTPIQLYSDYTSNPITNPFRVSTGSFFVGDDGQDNYQFSGTIDEIRMSNNLVLGAGFPLIVGNPPTGLSGLYYSKDTVAYATNVAINNDTPSVAGGTATHYSVSPSLPAGLNLDSNTGIISGTPTTPVAASNYTVTASNSGGSTTVVINVTVATAPSGLSYITNPAAYYVGTAIASNTPSVTGTVTSYSVSPSLPAGLSLNTTTGVISGVPTTATAAANYTIKASNGPVFTSTVLNITVVAPPSGLSYSANPATYGVGVSISPNNPTITGTAPITYSVNPALPAGLTLNTGTGVISGTPTQSAPNATYTITATNTYGSTSALVGITVISPPTNLSYATSPAYYLVNAAITPNSPTVTGLVTTYSITPALPTGLTLNTSTGVLSGTPVLPASGNYTITASNIAGSTVVVLNLTVSLPLSNLSYSTNPILCIVGSPITSDVPTITGSAPITYSANPVLPAGLTLSSTTGIISGTPTAATSAANYTITANNPAAGSTTVVLTLAVSTVGISQNLGSTQGLTLRISQSSAVTFDLPEEGARSAQVEILDMHGTRIWEGNADLTASENSLTWNGTTGGRVFSRGIYFARMTLWDANHKWISATNKKFVYLP